MRFQETYPCCCKNKVSVKLKNGKELTIQNGKQTMFWDASWKPITSEDFLNNLIGAITGLFKNEAELLELSSNPMSRKTLLDKLETAGYGAEELNVLQNWQLLQKQLFYIDV